MKARHEDMSQIQEGDSKKLFRISLPVSFQGHTFALDVQKVGEEHRPSGRYRVEFVLSDSFSGEQRAPTLDDWQSGFSPVALDESLSNVANIKLICERRSRPGVIGEATMHLQARENDRMLQRIKITLGEDSAESARSVASAMANQVLDYICYRKSVPLEVRRIDIIDDVDDTPIRSYIQVPYFSLREVAVGDIEGGATVPHELCAPMRILREAVNSHNAFYRVLCLFRVFEGLEKLRERNNGIAKSAGKSLTREKVTVPDTEVTRGAFPDFIGRSVHKFIDHVQSTVRLDVAHLRVNEYFELLANPGDVHQVHRVDQFNVVLIHLARQAIQVEWKFIRGLADTSEVR